MIDGRAFIGEIVIMLAIGVAIGGAIVALVWWLWSAI